MSKMQDSRGAKKAARASAEEPSSDPADGTVDPSDRPQGSGAKGLPSDADSSGARAQAGRSADLQVAEREAAQGAAGVDGQEGDGEGDFPILPRGNPFRWVRGLAVTFAGIFAAFCLMAVEAQFRFGVPLAAIGVLVASFGLLDFLGSFDDPDERVVQRSTLNLLLGPLTWIATGAVSMWLIVCLAVAGRLTTRFPVLLAGILVPASFLGIVVGIYRLCVALGVFNGPKDGEHRPLLRRHGFWLVVITTLVDLPFLGSHALSDPWETHYGEVAREILARNDWISTWWAQDGWFWSKPVLDFWLQAIAMATFGVRYAPGQMLSVAQEGRLPFPEWAVRLPIFLLTLIAVYTLYKAVARAYGRRAGLLGGVVLVSMPQWFLLTHQTMTDMPFVAPMATAMAFLLLGVQEDPNEEVRVYEVDLGITKLRFSAFHVVLSAIIVCALPQALYLVSRNVTLDLRGFHAHVDRFFTGSPGNCGLPGNEACRAAAPVIPRLQPAYEAILWVQALALVLYLNWGERRRQRLFFLAAWLFAALSTMAKGPAGVLLPGVCAVAYLAVTKRWRDVLRLEIASGAFIFLAVALPWFVAMYVRHGQPFTDRLLFHDMFKRAFTHVHDTNEGDDVSFRFYIWQLGYAMFPWTGLVPAALAHWIRRPDEGTPRNDTAVFLGMWALLAFSLFSMMLTKFHHYILPAVPPLAMLTGVLLDGLWKSAVSPPRDPKAPSRSEDASLLGTVAYLAGLAAGLVTILYGASKLVTFAREPAGKTGVLATGLVLLLVGAGALLITLLRLGHAAPGGDDRRDGNDGANDDEDSEAAPSLEEGSSDYRSAPRPASDALSAFRQHFDRIQLGAAGIAGAVLVLAVGRDLSATLDPSFPNQVRLMHLVTYNYRRPWPPSLDFTPTLWAFTALAAILMFALAAARIRRHVVSALLVLGTVFAVWGLDVYFVKISPHWGQRELILAYHEAARELPGPILAYQMNWKGENFYTGNHVSAFVSSGKKFEDYLLTEKQKGNKTFYFLTEHTRLTTLQNEVGPSKAFEKLTTMELDNKFLLVRARFE